MLADSGAGKADGTVMMPAFESREIPLLEQKSPSLRVLIVDDEPLLRWSLSETLAESGYEVTETSDGRATTSLLKEISRPFDVVLLDYRLPDSDDLSLLASIRLMWPQTPVVLMTAYGSPEVVRGALELGAFRVLSKPFEMGDIVGLLEAARRPH
jgi:DNA-binding NtrC family response regulator